MSYPQTSGDRIQEHLLTIRKQLEKSTARAVPRQAEFPAGRSTGL